MNGDKPLNPLKIDTNFLLLVGIGISYPVYSMELEKSPIRSWFWHRRNYIIAPKLQLKIVGLLVGVAIIASAIICFVAYERILLLDHLFNGNYVPPPLGKSTLTIVANTLMVRLVIIVSIMVCVFTVLGIYLTHKVAGPIWKLEHEIDEFLKGKEIKPIKFRKGDEFQRLPELVNKLIRGYKS